MAFCVKSPAHKGGYNNGRLDLKEEICIPDGS